ncbi:hypothetical protein YTPLAS18_09230 [Nitrospira sp.]|nr:hypothetical protein YTPLAS18_09230 [Nitrospira sp.]
MKSWLYAALILFAVPLQTTVLANLSLRNVEPDLVLVAVVLIGLLGGGLEGALMGVAMGFVQDLFSAGIAFPNLVTKGAMGIAAGLIGQQVVRVTPLVVLVSGLFLSAGSGMAFLSLARGRALWDAVLAVPTLVLPQAILDGMLAAAAFWAMTTVLPVMGGPVIPVRRLGRL